MVWYKDPDYLRKSDSKAYDYLYDPGAHVPHSGIYRCESCSAEIVIDKDRVFPPTHAGAAHGHKITWRLVAYPHHLT